MSLQGYWSDLKAPQFQNLPEDLVVVLPIGAVEQHGPHLPLSVDHDLVHDVIKRTLPLLSRDQNVLVLPALTVTKSNEHAGFPGTLSLSAETLLSVLRDLGASVARAGAERLVLFNGHGGNNAVLEIAAREMRIAHNMIVVCCSWFGFADMPPDVDEHSIAYDLHGGELETSAMLAARPDRVDMALANDFTPAMKDWEKTSRYTGLTGQAARPGWIIEDLNAQGACGNASVASAEKGDQLLDSAARNFARFLREFSDFDHRGRRT